MLNKNRETEEDPRIYGINGIIIDTEVGVQAIIEKLASKYATDPKYEDLDADSLAAAMTEGLISNRIDSIKIAKYIKDKRAKFVEINDI